MKYHHLAPHPIRDRVRFKTEEASKHHTTQCNAFCTMANE